MASDDLIRFDWEAGELAWVSIPTHWRTRTSAPELATRILSEITAKAADPIDTGLQCGTRSVALHEWEILADLQSRYNDERGRYLSGLPDDPTPATIVTKGGITATWHGARLTNLWIDDAWAEGQTAQRLSTTVVEVLRSHPSPAEDSKPPVALLAAKADLERFWS